MGEIWESPCRIGLVNSEQSGQPREGSQPGRCEQPLGNLSRGGKQAGEAGRTESGRQ